MLAKIEDSRVAQDSPGLKRICYGSELGDLYLWLNSKDKSLANFQLTFYTGTDDRQEQIIFWNGQHLRTGLVDSKEVDGRSHDLMTPTVQFYNKEESAMIAKGAQFLRAHGANIPAELLATLFQILAA